MEFIKMGLREKGVEMETLLNWYRIIPHGRQL
jgi:hypothetical protein